MAYAYTFNHSKLRELRIRHGLSREHIAAACACTASAVAMWEQGNRTPRGDLVGKLAGALHVTPSDLYTRSGR